MAATDGKHVIQVLDETPAAASAWNVPRYPAAEVEPPFGRCCKAVVGVLGVAFVLAFVAFVVLAVLDVSGPLPDYSVSITGAAALASGDKYNATAIPTAALLDLTVRIRNPSRMWRYCVWSDATVVVSTSRGGATIGAGTVPRFCAGRRAESEVVVPVWAAGADDVRPPGGDAVDVAIRMPYSEECNDRWYEAEVAACRVRVGGSLSQCTSQCILWSAQD